MLEELLAPHGLAVRDEEGGSLVIVSLGGEDAPAVLRGTVRARGAWTPLPGVTVTVPGSGASAVTGPDGRYLLAGLEPGERTVRASRSGFAIEERSGIRLVPGRTTELAIELSPAPTMAEQIVVNPSRISVLQEEPVAPLSLSREQMLRLPQLGGDVFRTLSLLPGIAADDVAAQFHIRGGRRDEVLVLLDGQELYEAYHLKDFDNALSVVAASGLSRLDLTTGAFPSSYGDRMGGILDLSTTHPSRARRFRLSVSVLTAQLEGSGSLGDRLWFLGSLRRGTTDFAGRIFGREDPSFWDLFGRVDYRLSAAQSLRANLLHSTDQLEFTEEQDGETTRLDTDYDNTYVWVTHQAIPNTRLIVETAVSASRIERDRRGGEHDQEKDVEVRDERDLQIAGLQNSWGFQASARHFLKAGFEARRFEAEYDYDSARAFDTELADLRSEPRDGTFRYQASVPDDYLTAYVSDRITAAENVTLELGWRFDGHTATDDGLWSPRANLAWGIGRSSVLRLGWGQYFQSQRVYELMVVDGDTSLYPAERSEHWVAGLEQLFSTGTSRKLSLSALRLEAYSRRVSKPRPRYENSREPLDPLPEGALDRIRIAPESAQAYGVELFLQGRIGGRLEWWLNYGYGRTEDEIDGETVSRQIDQRNAFNFDLSYKLGRGWDVNAAWRLHTGWRVTPVLLGVDDEGDPVPVLGPLYSEGLPTYQRLDLRVSRRWQAKSGFWTLFLDIQNVFDASNTSGFDVEFDEETGRLLQSEEFWPGFFPSLGISWEF
jgi:outer membrane cobalamin receptor